MTRKKRTHTPESARARVGQLFALHGWNKHKRGEWLDKQAHLSAEELFRAAEAELGVDHTVWRDVESQRGRSAASKDEPE